MIEVNNLTRNKIDEDFLKRVAEKVLARRQFDLSIALVDEKRIKELNEKYRKRNKVTDVLSFQYYDDSGEVVICPLQVKKNAKRFTPLEITGTGEKDKKKKSLTGFNSTYKKELARVLIHGILHLLGYDHEKNEKEADKMRKKEADYLISEMN